MRTESGVIKRCHLINSQKRIEALSGRGFSVYRNFTIGPDEFHLVQDGWIISVNVAEEEFVLDYSIIPIPIQSVFQKLCTGVDQWMSFAFHQDERKIGRVGIRYKNDSILRYSHVTEKICRTFKVVSCGGGAVPPTFLL